MLNTNLHTAITAFLADNPGKTIITPMAWRLFTSRHSQYAGIDSKVASLGLQELLAGNNPPAIEPAIEPETDNIPLPVQIIEKEKEPAIEPETKPVPVSSQPIAQPSDSVIANAIAEALRSIGFAPQGTPALTEQQIRAIVAEEVAKLSPDSVSHPIIINKIEQGQIPQGASVPCFFERLLHLTAARRPVLLYGPPGSGKSYAATLLSQSLNIPFAQISLSGGIDESHLQGWLLPSDSGKYEYTESSIVSVWRNGGVLLLDELDGADDNVLLVLNSMLDGYNWAIPTARQAFPRHHDCIIIATANTSGDGLNPAFPGRRQLDAATLNRFRVGMIPVTYDRKLEKELYGQEIAETCQTLRDRLESMQSLDFVSMRNMRDMRECMSFGLTLEQAFYGMVSHYDKETLRQLRVSIDDTAMSACLN